jgi:hypothetical protein
VVGIAGHRTERSAITSQTTVARPARGRLRPLAAIVERHLTWIESVVVFAAAALATYHAESRLIRHALVVQSDARIHEYWMRRFQDPALFHDPITNALLATGYSPPAFRAVFWLASHVVDPVLFGELLPLLLQPLAVLLLFHIVRAHTDWRPAAWIAAALFLFPWDINRFSGGHSRAFEHPFVLLTVLLLVRRFDFAAALVPVLAFLFYPPAGLATAAIVALAALARGRRFFIDPRRAPAAALALGSVGVAALVIRLIEGPHPLITEADAHRYPEFGPRGQMHFFTSTTAEYLRQNYSGFNLRDSGSIIALAALLLLVVRVRNALLLRWEIWCMAIAALALFVAAHLLLFRLYLPQRYTYPLLPFFCIVVGVTLRPTLEALAARARPALLVAPLVPIVLGAVALAVFPLGPDLSRAATARWLDHATPFLVGGLVGGLIVGAVLWGRGGRDYGARALAAATAIVAGAVLVGEVAYAGGMRSPAIKCGEKGLYRYLATTPKDAIVGGDARIVDCVPIAARRPVVISRELYQPWDVGYFELTRPRMFASARAAYSPNIEPILALRSRYGADYFLTRNTVPRVPWHRMAPFTGVVGRYLRSGETPAALELPRACAVWHNPRFTLYDLGCVAQRR